MPATAEQKALEICVCHKVRMAARGVTRVYDEALRPVGLRATQLSPLLAIAVDGAMSITALAKLIGMDRSTLTRNLRPLEKQKLIVIGTEGRHRSRTLAITKRGRERLREAVPVWERAQAALRAKLGDAQWARMQDSLDHMIRAT